MSTERPSVTRALQQVDAWKEAQLRENQAKIAEVDKEIADIEAKIALLQQQIVALREARTSLEALDLSRPTRDRINEAIFATLAEQSALTSRRAEEQLRAEKALQEKVFADMKSGELAPVVEEYVQFKEKVEPTLSALPASYREAILQHHRGVVERLRAHLAERLAEPATIDAPPVEVDVVFGIDAPEGRPELLICILPLHHEVLTAWADRATDVGTLLGARVAQAIFETTKRLGPPGVHVVYGGYQDLLTMEVEIDGTEDNFAEVFTQTMQAIFADAPELKAAGIRPVPVPVDADHLLPPEDDEEA